MNAMTLFHEGGFIMYPLAVCSVLVWTVAIHKYFVLRAFVKEYKKMDSDIQHAITTSKIGELKWIFKNSPGLISYAHEPLLEDHYTSPDALNEKIHRRLQEVNSFLKQHLWLLGTIGSSAPFIGLFGTVLGIMESFRAIGATGKSGFSVVAGGISESLIATAAGIVVAVVAVMFYNYFQTRVNAIAQDFRHKLADTTELLMLTKTGK